MILAFLYRLRGMHESTDTFEARLFVWSVPVAVFCIALLYLYGLPMWWGCASLLLTLGGISLGHSFAQSNTGLQYAEMGLVSFTRLEGALLPLLMAPVFGWYPFHPIIFYVVAAFFFLTWAASALSYTRIFQSRKLRLFGVTWCTPGDSSWEELLVGLCYDIAFATLIIKQIWG